MRPTRKALKLTVAGFSPLRDCLRGTTDAPRTREQASERLVESAQAIVLSLFAQMTETRLTTGAFR